MKLLDNLKLALAGKRVVDLAQKETGFDPWVAAVKVGKAMGWAALGVSTTAVVMAFGDPEAVLRILIEAGLSPKMAGALSLLIVGLIKLAGNWSGNRTVTVSPIDKQPVDVNAASPGPVLQTEEQHDAFEAEYHRLRNGGVAFDDARKLALAHVIGAKVGP